MRPVSCPSCGSKKKGHVGVRWEGSATEARYSQLLTCRACGYHAVLQTQSAEEHAKMSKNKRRASLIARTNRLRARRPL